MQHVLLEEKEKPQSISSNRNTSPYHSDAVEDFDVIVESVRTDGTPSVYESIQCWHIVLYIGALVGVDASRPVRHLPWWTALWLLMTLGIYAWEWDATDGRIHTDKDYIGEWLYENAGALRLPDTSPSIWIRFFTYSLTHMSIAHIISNVCMLFFFSSILEYRHGMRRIAPIFFCSAIASAMTMCLVVQYNIGWSKNQSTVISGSSGIVYALAGVYIADNILNHESIRDRIVFMFLTFLILISPLIDCTISGYTGSVGTIIHISGLIFGLLPAAWFVPNEIVESHEKILAVFSLLGIAWFGLAQPILILKRWLHTSS
jgi:membrane associated rhomboid family serine protease